MSTKKSGFDYCLEELSLNEDLLFDDGLEGNLDNARTAVRYLRDDIKVSFKANRLFKRVTVPEAKLIDISSKGAYISCSSKLKINKTITLIFTFNDGKQFKIDARVVHKFPQPSDCYGIKFDKVNHDLGDYMLETQDNLKFS